jgi:hypothetical protein
MKAIILNRGIREKLVKEISKQIDTDYNALCMDNVDDRDVMAGFIVDLVFTNINIYRSKIKL